MFRVISIRMRSTRRAHKCKKMDRCEWKNRGGRCAESREWQCTLKKINGKVISVKLSVFIEKDQKLITDHFGIVPSRLGVPSADKIDINAEGNIVGLFY